MTMTTPVRGRPRTAPFDGTYEVLPDVELSPEQAEKARKLIDQAKGRLTSEYGHDEQTAWRFIQTRAMNERVKIAEIARRVVDGELAP